MFLFNRLRLIIYLATIGLIFHFVTIGLIFHKCIDFIQYPSLPFNDSVRNYSCVISSIDKIPNSILSLLSSDIYNDNYDKTDFLMQCRYEHSNDRPTLSKIDEFELNYCSEEAILWYTRDTFVHRIVNKALSSKNAQMINKCRFLIRDLHQQISYLHQNNYQRDIVQPSQTYYCGMTLSAKDLDRLVIGRLITFDKFSSASSSREVALMFAGNALLQIEVNNRTGLHGVFHLISDISNFKDEEEILFSIGNVFRVEQIHWCEKKSLWEIKLILQKHIQYRCQFGMQSTNNIKWKFVKSTWEGLIKLSDKVFKFISSHPFRGKTLLKSDYTMRFSFHNFFFK